MKHLRGKPFHEKLEPGPCLYPELGDCLNWVMSKTNQGYGHACFNKKVLLAHRVAWMIRHGSIPEGMCVLHKCDNPSCCNVDHLFLGTNDDNVADKVAKGRVPRGDWHSARLRPETVARGDRHGSKTKPHLMPRGERCGNSKLNEDAVREIRRLWSTGTMTKTSIGAQFGVTQVVVGGIVRRVRWKHVE
jgi:hypothetical protein